MKILWYNDMPIEGFKGGAELSISVWEDEGIERGHEFYNVNVQNVSDLPYYTKKADVAFISSIYHTHDQHIDRLCTKLPYIKHEHDVGYCFLRDIHCRNWILFMSEGFGPPCAACPHIRDPNERKLATKHVDRYNEILNNAKAMTFSSPIQYNVFMDALGCTGKPPEILRPPGIRVEYFRKRKRGERTNGAVFVGDSGSKKGVGAAIKYGLSLGPLNPMSLIGYYPDHFIVPSNFKIYPKLSPKQMNVVYNQHTHVFQHPEVFDACPRVFFEAKLAGCIPLVNDNVGATSWHWAGVKSVKKLRSILSEAPNKFWDDLEEFL